MTLQDILRVKGHTVYTITPEANLIEAARELVQHNVGSLVVCREEPADDGNILGIVTERDLLHAQAAAPALLEQTKVSVVMSSSLITASPEDSVEATMGLMTSRRIRHLPVLSAAGKLVGLISIGDIVKAQHDRLAMENRFMKDYIQS